MDWVTLSRIIISPVLLILIFHHQRNWFQWLLLIGLLSDLADGYITRRLHITTEHGARLDSAADATIFTVALIGAVWFEPAFVKQVAPLLAGVFVLYFLKLAYGILKYKRPSSFHTYMAKAAAMLQGIFLITLFFSGPVLWLFYLTVAVSGIQVIEEIALIALLPKWKTNVKGLLGLKTKPK